MTGVEPALAAAAMGTAAGAGTATAAGLTAAEIAALAAAAETAAATAAPVATAYGLSAAPAIAAEVAAPTVAATTTGGGLLGSAGTATGMEAGSASAFGPMSGANEFGYQGLSSLYSNPANTQFMTGSAGELAGIGGQGQSLATTTANAMSMPAASSTGLSTNDAFRLAQQGYKMANGQDKQQQPGRAQMMPGSPEEMAQRRKSEIGAMSPYQNRQGFTPRRYGANLRRGLLEG